MLDSLPESVSAGQAVWTPDETGLGVVCVGFKHDPFRLGMVYHNIRPSEIYHIEFSSSTSSSKCHVIGANNSAVRCPVFSPDKSKFVFLENEAGGPHMRCSRLKMCDWFVF